VGNSKQPSDCTKVLVPNATDAIVKSNMPNVVCSPIPLELTSIGYCICMHKDKKIPHILKLKKLKLSKELFVLLATASDTETIVKGLTQACEKYNEAHLLGNEMGMQEAVQELKLHTHLFIMHNITDGKLTNAMDILDDMDKMTKAKKFFETEKN
jgi:hypothetical protein